MRTGGMEGEVIRGDVGGAGRCAAPGDEGLKAGGFLSAKKKDRLDGGLLAQHLPAAQRFFLNLYSTPTEMAKFTSYWLTLGA
jgi:hypothetical protein